VANCSRPSTANESTSSESSLSPPPISPEKGGNSKAQSEKVGRALHADLAFNYDVAQETTIEENAQTMLDPESVIAPYVNPESDFDYFDQEGHAQPDVKLDDPDLASKFKFPKLTSATVFENYLRNPQDMSYNDVYQRTAAVSQVLATWQDEYDAIDKEIHAHEAAMKEVEKLELERKKEAEKKAEEESRIADEKDRNAVACEFKQELQLTGNAWTSFLSQMEDDPDTLRHLQNLRNPQFMANIAKQQAQREKELERAKIPVLENVPYPEIKLTKEEIDAEKRKRGRIIDPIKFDDMKMADVYGFEYSAHLKHFGQQPAPIITRKRGANGIESIEVRGSRTQRTKTKRTYDQSSPEDESEEQLPAKRPRKPRVFDDGNESVGRSRNITRPSTPRTFASGKLIGRPPKSLSKLKDVQLASVAEPASGTIIAGPENNGESSSSAQQLQPAEEAQLQKSAESLVNQTLAQPAAEPPVKKKHAGGRPRKNPLPPVVAESSTAATTNAPPVKKNKGGRPRKHPLPTPSAPAAPSEAPPPPTLAKKVGRRIKKEPVAENLALELDDEPNGVMQSTEQDDDTDVASRPTSSSSHATVSEFGTRRSARSLTREKTMAREAKVAVKRKEVESITEESVVVEEPVYEPSRGKRKRGGGDTAVDGTPPAIAPQPKKRKPRAIKEEQTIDEEPVVEASSSRGKRKRGDEAGLPPPSADAPPAKKGKTRASKGELPSQLAAAKTLPARKAKVTISTTAGPSREPSTRVRRPPRSLGLDGTNDDDSDMQLTTEYEAYQALTSPKSPLRLGKRVRKSYINLADAMTGEDDFDDAFEGDDSIDDEW